MKVDRLLDVEVDRLLDVEVDRLLDVEVDRLPDVEVDRLLLAAASNNSTIRRAIKITANTVAMRILV